MGEIRDAEVWRTQESNAKAVDGFGFGGNEDGAQHLLQFLDFRRRGGGTAISIMASQTGRQVDQIE